ncbi:MAG: Gfo/Idh/MocA family oxidoreductase [Victivallaceae bacterium]|nr:Gfo/Idh/MocA family oxidoreductase [Victivallaceae bacterium]MDD4180009.1 Gfo/Idh/MocA family oxidoreductase [Victivallaceae bacterium]
MAKKAPVKNKSKKKYVLVGTGGRSAMYTKALMQDYTDVGELLAFCDTNQARMDYWNSIVVTEYKKKALPTFKADEFDKMIAKFKPDTVIVTTMDRTHHTYICRAMELGCDVITEKPMTVDAEKCQEIIDTSKRTGKKVTVTFNYRYSPRNTKIKEILRSGIVGDVNSIHFEWLLSTVHGADYFRRWHRNKNNSGGLMVHKSTHHFDLVNWWIDSFPETVFAMGDLMFYGKENAENRGVREFYYRAKGSSVAKKDPFALKVTAKDERLKGLYFGEAEKEDNYFRDQSVFGDGISIEDNMGVMVRYRNKTIMTYSLNAHSPWEGYRVCFNGTKGRLEFNVVETPYISGNHADFNQPGMHELDCAKENMVPEIIFQPHWGKAQVIDYERAVGGHGGGDTRLLDHLFKGAEIDPLGHSAGCEDGAKSILVGIAANKSMKTGLPVEVKTLVEF